MILASALGLALAAADPADPHAPLAPADASASARDEYRDRAAKAGRTARDQVELALWCEANGLRAERARHLALAVAAEPDSALARGLLGMVRQGDRWVRPERAAERHRGDEALAAKLAEYDALRAEADDTADGHWRLALWCEGAGLEAEAKAHFTAVTRLDPAREAAWKRLGCKKYQGRWMTPERVAEEKAEAAAQKRADQAWFRRLSSLRKLEGQRGRRDDAERALVEVTDPRAARAVWTVFALGGEADQVRAVQLFGQIESPEASVDLAALSIHSPSPRVRRLAAETLLHRDPRDFLGRLIGQIATPLKYEVRHVDGPGRPGVLFVEGEQFNIRMIYEAPLPPGRAALDPSRPPAAGRVARVAFEPQIPGRFSQLPQGLQPLPGSAPDPDPGFTPFPGPGAERAQPDRDRDRDRERREEERRREEEQRREERRREEEDPARRVARQWEEARRAAASSQERLRADIAAVEAYNAMAERSNAVVMPVVEAVSGRQAPPDRKEWMKWWTNERGYAYPDAPKPTFERSVPPLYQPKFAAIGSSCFRAGTPVWTIDGLRPIEQVRVGDRVLSQDTCTGALDYRPVVAALHNPPAATLALDLGEGGTIVATPIHRFWRPGKGWVMARELKPGEAIRTLGGTARVVSVTPRPAEPVFNLEVPEGRTFFVGEAGALVHDHGLVAPVVRPFDAPAEVASAPSRPADPQVPRPGRRG